MTRRFTLAISHVLGVYRDIPAPDVNTNAQVMAWMMDAFSATARLQPRRSSPASRSTSAAPRAARRPPAGACVLRARGVPQAPRPSTWPALRVADPGLRQRRLVGWPTRSSTRRQGRRGLRRVAAASSTRRARRRRAGRARRRRAAGWPTFHGGDVITNEELLALECDVLVPAALGEVITDDNADQVQARVVLEAANYPVTPGGDKILARPGRRGRPRHPRQRRRRDRLVLRVGAEHPAVHVEGSSVQRRAAPTGCSWRTLTVQDFADARHCSLRDAAYAIGSPCRRRPRFAGTSTAELSEASHIAAKAGVQHSLR